MNGTEWTEPGRGATVGALIRAMHANGVRTGMRALLVRANLLDAKPTNLRLTGAPLTADDLKRIAGAK